jgi:hypothetical protein
MKTLRFGFRLIQGQYHAQGIIVIPLLQITSDSAIKLIAFHLSFELVHFTQ